MLYYFKRAWQMLISPKLIKNSKVSKKSKVMYGVTLRNVSLDDYSYIGENSVISYCSIGKYCSIADNTYIGGGSHPLSFVSTSPAFCEGRNCLNKHFAYHQFNSYRSITIGNDVWIGKGVCIKAGVIISDGAVVGMGAVVTKDIGPYEIWAGNPAKLIRKRFDEQTIQKLLKIKWWNKSEEELEKIAGTFNNVNDFIISEEEK
jgi:acetyltransferase-like isoleucine patch superfamily enzyme